MINVILAAPGRTGIRPSRVLSVAQLLAEEPQPEPKRAKMNFHPTLSFLEEDKIRTTQPHDDALLITLRIGDYDVKKVMVDGGSATEVMYPDLYKGLNLKLEDLTPLQLSFDELRRKTSYFKRHDQVTHPDQPRDNGGELYRGGYLLSIYSHCRQALAPYFGGYCLLFAREGEIPFRRPGPRNPWLPIHGKAVCSGRHFASA